MKLSHSIITEYGLLPAGADIAMESTSSCIGTIAGYQVNLLRLSLIAVEGNGSELAELLVKQLSHRYSGGFTKKQLELDYGDNIAGCQYAVLQVDDEHMLMLKTKDDEAIELYLYEADGTYKFTGEYHVASDASQSMSVESEASLLTKGTLAMRCLVSNIASLLEDLPSIDRPELIRILRIASQSVSSGSSKLFLQSVGSKYTI